MYVCYASRTSDYHKRLQLPHQRSPPIQGNDIYAEVICVSKSIRFVYCPSVCVMMCSTFNLSSLIFPHSPHFYHLICREPGRCCTHLDRVVQPISTIPSTHLDLNRRVHHLTIASRPHPLPSYNHPRGRGIIIIINNTKQQIEG